MNWSRNEREKVKNVIHSLLRPTVAVCSLSNSPPTFKHGTGKVFGEWKSDFSWQKNFSVYLIPSSFRLENSNVQFGRYRHGANGVFSVVSPNVISFRDSLYARNLREIDFTTCGLCYLISENWDRQSIYLLLESFTLILYSPFKW